MFKSKKQAKHQMYASAEEDFIFSVVHIDMDPNI